MEFLVARAFADHILGGDRERSGALMTATHLTARNLVASPVSQTFLGELLLATIDDRERKSSGRAVGRTLFDIMVVRESGQGILAKFLARFALLRLSIVASGLKASRGESIFAQSLGRQLMNFTRSGVMFSFFLIYLVSLPLAMLSTLFEGLRPHANKLGATQFPLSIAFPLSLGAFCLCASPLLLLSVRSSRLVPAVRLWLNCCEVIGVSREDLVEICGSKVLVQMHKEIGPKFVREIF
jgi:hypothetical protein